MAPARSSGACVGVRSSTPEARHGPYPLCLIPRGCCRRCGLVGPSDPRGMATPPPVTRTGVLRRRVGVRGSGGGFGAARERPIRTVSDLRLVRSLVPDLPRDREAAGRRRAGLGARLGAPLGALVTALANPDGAPPQRSRFRPVDAALRRPRRSLVERGGTNSRGLWHEMKTASRWKADSGRVQHVVKGHSSNQSQRKEAATPVASRSIPSVRSSPGSACPRATRPWHRCLAPDSIAVSPASACPLRREPQYVRLTPHGVSLQGRSGGGHAEAPAGAPQANAVALAGTQPIDPSTHRPIDPPIRDATRRR